jgi:hypothetical protein
MEKDPVEPAEEDSRIAWEYWVYTNKKHIVLTCE